MSDLLYLIAVILLIVFLLGIFGVIPNQLGLGDFIWVLLVLAIVAVLFRLIGGRRV